jgi:hypothetical protein
MPASETFDMQKYASADASMIGVVHIANCSVYSEGIDNAAEVGEVLLVGRALIDHSHLPASVKEDTGAMISAFGSILFREKLYQILIFQLAMDNIGKKG